MTDLIRRRYANAPFVLLTVSDAANIEKGMALNIRRGNQQMERGLIVVCVVAVECIPYLVKRVAIKDHYRLTMTNAEKRKPYAPPTVTSQLTRTRHRRTLRYTCVVSPSPVQGAIRTNRREASP